MVNSCNRELEQCFGVQVGEIQQTFTEIGFIKFHEELYYYRSCWLINVIWVANWTNTALACLLVIGYGIIDEMLLVENILWYM